MFLMFEALMVELLTTAPDMVLLLGAHEIPRQRRRKFITVRHGHRAALVER